MISTLGFNTIHPDHCARTLGRDMRTCRCCLPGGGWLPCPPEAQGVLVPMPPVPLPPLTATVFARGVALGDSVLTVEERSGLAYNAATVLRLSQTPRVDDAIEQGDNFTAKAAGYTGNECDYCGSVRMRQAGTCELCDDCGESGACG